MQGKASKVNAKEMLDLATLKAKEDVKDKELKAVEATIDLLNDLTIRNDSQNEFTHAKFLDDAKVEKRFEEIRPKMATTYPFELDKFQKKAIVSMEASDSVFVAAHTSAGKTVVAEYAIALSKSHNTRVIYTSPIKALSNQKYREFKLLFGDVGLITGDIQLNPNAFCLVMTTEVLRSMLYNGSEVIREMEWVIFDEVHYINDTERGYVWEESLIMLPPYVSIVMLSATVPNCIEFADWVGRIKQRQITVIQTLKRPVPLEHYIYTGYESSFGKKLFLLMNKTDHLSPHGHMEAIKSIEKSQKPVESIAQNEFSVYSKLIALLNAKNCLPVVVFVFSCKRCDSNATMLEDYDLTNSTEKDQITKFFDKCIGRLGDSGKQLRQVVWMRELCNRGYAVHHSGILPILKEVVELLFQKGLVKVLFATETFAMGVNMPARTVVFDAIKKYDGDKKRSLNPTEYTQMAGRAGRRGLDDTGIVIILVKQDVPSTKVFSQLLIGTAVNLDSRFRVTYAMILKLLRVEQVKIEDMLQSSYVERSSLRLAVSRKKQIVDLNSKISKTKAVCERCQLSGPGYTRASIEELLYNLQTYFKVSSSVWATSMGVLMSKWLVKGRVLLINYPALGLLGRLAVLLKINEDEQGQWLMTVYMPADEATRMAEIVQLQKFYALSDDEQNSQAQRLKIEYAASNGLFKVQANSRMEQSYRVINDMNTSHLLAICKQGVQGVDADLIIRRNIDRYSSTRNKSSFPAVKTINAALHRFSEQWSKTEPPIAMFAVDIRFRERTSYNNIQPFIFLQSKLRNNLNYPCKQCLNFGEHFSDYLEYNALSTKLDLLTYQTSTNALLLSKDYEKRIKVLKSLGYIDKNNMIGLKGKAACEVSHLEVLITELIFMNKFDGKSCAEVAAMLSVITNQYTYMNSRLKDRSMSFRHEVNSKMRDEIIEMVNPIDIVQRDCGIENAYFLDELRFSLMDVVYEWASGTDFSELESFTECQEGLVVRCIQRLEEVLKDIRKAARIIGNSALYDQIEETSQMIRRGIVFSPSLYTSAETE